MPDSTQSARNKSLWIVGLLAVAGYINTLIGDFTFDDNFAVITNGDVTSNGNPVIGLFKHDFWGQDITSQQSHKSYRPITVLIFRWTRQAWDIVQLLIPGINGKIPTPAPVLQGREQQDAFGGARSPRPPGLHPFPFHVLSVLLHATVSMMVLALAQHLFAKLEPAADSTHTSTEAHNTSSNTPSKDSSSTKPSAALPHSLIWYSERHRGWRGMLDKWLMWQQRPRLWLVPRSSRGQFQALAAAVLFALHPIHTEAVAGVVGCAELICAVWSLLALLLYCMAVDGRYPAARLLQQHITSGYVGNTNSSNSNGPGDKNNASTAGSNSSRGKKQVQHSRRPSPAAASAAAAAAAAAHDPAVSGDPVLSQLYVADSLQHWFLVSTAASLAVLSSLSKEIGITITGTMMLYDLLLAPHMQQPKLNQISSSSKPHSSCSNVPGGVLQQQQGDVLIRRFRFQIIRVLLLLITAVCYVKLRSWVAVQQLVAIYRKVENPIPFADSLLTRTMSTGYLHTRYFSQLLLPIYLSADWSYSCIPLVEAITDPRNIGTGLLYGYLVYVGLTAAPLQLAGQLLGVARGAVLGPAAAGAAGLAVTTNELQNRAPRPAAAAAAAVSGGQTPLGCPAADRLRVYARWRLLIVVGLLIAPFFPASNVLFYVGTFIGERLLYMPSVGYCLLIADMLGRLVPAAPVQDQQQGLDSKDSKPVNGVAADATDPIATGSLAPAAVATPQPSAGVTVAGASPAVLTNSGPSFSDWSRQPHAQHHLQQQIIRCSGLRRALALLLLLLLSAAYAGRTVMRNMDWWDEERLFLSAEKVCANSAKVQQNCGVLQRRYQNYGAAMRHFRRAQEIEPGYCEPSYWIALTRINQGDVSSGLSAMKDSLSCKYTAAEALQTLNKLYLMMHETAQNDPMPMVEWAAVLSSPTVLRVGDACSTVEDAAQLAVGMGKPGPYIDKIMDVCWQGIKAWKQAGQQEVAIDTMAGLARVRYADTNITLLHKCVRLRRAVYKKMSGQKPKSSVVKEALYRYIKHVQAKCPGCRTLAGGGSSPGDGDHNARIPSTHQKLLHRLQSADPEDPWLQLEWGQTLIALGGNESLKEAAMHMEVASAIFTKLMQQLQDTRAAGTAQPARTAVERKLALVTTLDGAPLTPESALEAAIMSLEIFRAVAASADARDVRMSYCDVLKRLCHLRLQMVVLVQQQTASAAGPQGDERGVTTGLREASRTKLVLNAKAAGRRCLVELSEQQGCEKQADDMRQLVGRGD